MGPCNFQPALKSFAGTPVEQASCLMSPVLLGGKLGSPLDNLPAVFAHAGQAAGLPDRAALYALLQARNLEGTFGFNFAQPVSQTDADGVVERSARYFVIHDTSGPNYRNRAWPDNINDTAGFNNLENFSCSNNIERAHVFINRMGAILLAHDFEVPWRATKFESAVNFGVSLRGLFIHAEMIQPRKRARGYRGSNDYQAPDPGFSQAQYDTLALAYTVASVRAGAWLIPAFHAVIDEGIHDKHDDPQNFEIAKFAQGIESLLTALKSGQAEARASGVAGSQSHPDQ